MIKGHIFNCTILMRFFLFILLFSIFRVIWKEGPKSVLSSANAWMVYICEVLPAATVLEALESH